MAKYIFRTKPCNTLNEIMRNPWQTMAAGMEWIFRRSGPLAIGAGEATAFIRVAQDAEEADAQLLFVNFASLDYKKGLEAFPGIMLNYCVCRPKSRGAITLRSSDPAAPPVIKANYLSDPEDLAIMRGAAEYCRKIAAQSPLKDLIEEELRPGLGNDLDHVIRSTAGTVFHPCGSARMRTDAHAVVDPELRVRRVQGLRVADAWVFPSIPSPNIQPAAPMVGERCADFMLSTI